MRIPIGRAIHPSIKASAAPRTIEMTNEADAPHVPNARIVPSQSQALPSLAGPWPLSEPRPRASGRFDGDPAVSRRVSGCRAEPASRSSGGRLP